MAYTSIDDPTIYFNTVLYTGNGSSGRTVTGVGFAPNWVWIKDRGATGNHQTFDTIRGVTETLQPDRNIAETAVASMLTAFGSDGFTVGDHSGVNDNTNTYVAWNWKAGTSFSNDASATSVGSIDSAGSVNTDAGFSITSYTGTGSAATVAHGLGVVPSVYILKNRTSTSNWFFYHKSTGATKSLFLDGSEAPIASSGYFNNTEPTSSVFSIGSESDLSGSSQNMIAYCFAEKKGYSKFGSYVGNGNNDGTFVYTGFKPAFIILKNTSQSQNWYIYDNKRTPTNFAHYHIYADLSNAEANGNTFGIDILSNGWKIKTSNDGWNGSGEVYVYMAFAESPFVNSNDVPNNAR